MMKRIAIFLILALSPAFAAAADHGLDAGAERHLNGHGFLPSQYLPDPWTATTFQNYTGGGVALGLKTPFYDVDGTPLFTLEGDLFYASLGLGLQQRLGERFAVGMKFDGLIRTGTNAQTLIAEGANVDRTANLWFKYRLVRTDASQFTLGIDWDYKKTFIITPFEFARDIIDGNELTEAALLSSIKNWTARLTGDYAHAFSPAIGVRANLAVGLYEEPFADGVSKATHRGGVLGEYDLQPGPGIPLGITLGYTKGFPTDDPGAGLAGVLFGLWYTGREAFVLGVETGFMTLPAQADAEKVDAAFGLFTIRYYF